tara:strand:- start:1440 stop:1949 length:510 start_codon:yes stop_codon:yes gene_type:complete
MEDNNLQPEIVDPPSADEIETEVPDVPEPAPEPDPVLKPKKKRTVAQEEGLKKAQEIRKKNIELRKAEKLVAAQELVKEKKAVVPPPPPPPPAKKESSLKEIREALEILDLKKKVIPESDTDSEEEIAKLEKRLAKKKSLRRQRIIKSHEPMMSRNTVNTVPKIMLSFS